MTEDLRAALRAELSAERPPPLGDLVGAAMREGRRIRRKRRLGTWAACLVAAGVLAGAAVTLQSDGIAERVEPAVPVAAEPPVGLDPLPPGNVPEAVLAPTALAATRTLTIHSGTDSAKRSRTKATPAAMLHLLTQLLPPGRTSHYGVAPDDDLHVQLYLDGGAGPGLVRVWVNQDPPARSQRPRGATVSVTISHVPGDCLRATVVDADWPDGTAVRVDVPTCLAAEDVPSRPALTAEQAVRVATDPRWGVTMDAKLVAAGAREFPELPAFAR